jgi:thymidylate kinase
VDERLAAEALAAVARAVPEGVVLWRGEGLDGNEVDVVAVPGRGHAVARALREHGLTPAPQDPGRVLWRRLPGETVVVDVLAPHAWPARYPALDGVLGRAQSGSLGLPLASAGDRLLIHAAEAVAGWPMAKTTRRLRAAWAEPGAGQSLAAAARAEPGLDRLARLAQALATGAEAADGRPDVLALPVALRAAARSAQGRAALGERLATAAGVSVRPPLPRVARPPGDGAPRPRLIALSGMDGAGKSTAGLDLLEALEAAGQPAVVHWTRLAGELGLLDRMARRVRRVLGRETSLADPEAPAPAAPAANGGGDGVIDAVWVLAVAGAAVRNARRAGRIRRRGLTVLCDRWLADALVDLRVRYGRRPAAEWLLRRGFPRADVAVLLEVDGATAARRKPGDQTEAVLHAMSERYAEVGDRLGLPRVDASAPPGEVATRLRALALRA